MDEQLRLCHRLRAAGGDTLRRANLAPRSAGAVPKITSLLGEALSRRSGFPNQDGSDDAGEVIFTGLWLRLRRTI